MISDILHDAILEIRRYQIDLPQCYDEMRGEVENCVAAMDRFRARLDTPDERMKRLVQPLPCPFCGVIPEVGPPNDSEGTCFGWVECMNEKCSVNPKAEDRREVNGDEGREHYQQMAIRNWNIRMPNDPSSATEARK